MLLIIMRRAAARGFLIMGEKLKNNADAQLKQEFESLKKVFAICPIAVFWKNKEGAYLGCNEFGAKQVSMWRSEIFQIQG